MKVLCLHGYTQSGPSFKRKTSKLQSHIQKHFPDAVFVFPTAPTRLIPSEWTDNPERELLLRRFATNKTLGPEYGSDMYAWMYLYNVQQPGTGFYDGIDLLADVLAKEGPFDGVIGFSQGGAIAAVLASLLEGQVRREALDRHHARYPDSVIYPESFKNLNHPPLKFGITYSSGVGLGTAFAGLYQDPPVQIPFCHFSGFYDTFLSAETVQTVKKVRIGDHNGRTIIHPGGHALALSQQYLDMVIDFLKSINLDDSTTLQPLDSKAIPVQEMSPCHIYDEDDDDDDDMDTNPQCDLLGRRQLSPSPNHSRSISFVESIRDVSHDNWKSRSSSISTYSTAASIFSDTNLSDPADALKFISAEDFSHIVNSQPTRPNGPMPPSKQRRRILLSRSRTTRLRIV